MKKKATHSVGSIIGAIILAVLTMGCNILTELTDNSTNEIVHNYNHYITMKNRWTEKYNDAQDRETEIRAVKLGLNQFKELDVSGTSAEYKMGWKCIITSMTRFLDTLNNAESSQETINTKMKAVETCEDQLDKIVDGHEGIEND